MNGDLKQEGAEFRGTMLKKKFFLGNKIFCACGKTLYGLVDLRKVEPRVSLCKFARFGYPKPRTNEVKSEILHHCSITSDQSFSI